MNQFCVWKLSLPRRRDLSVCFALFASPWFCFLSVCVLNLSASAQDDCLVDELRNWFYRNSRVVWNRDAVFGLRLEWGVVLIRFILVYLTAIYQCIYVKCIAALKHLCVCNVCLMDFSCPNIQGCYWSWKSPRIYNRYFHSHEKSWKKWL